MTIISLISPTSKEGRNKAEAFSFYRSKVNGGRELSGEPATPHEKVRDHAQITSKPFPWLCSQSKSDGLIADFF
jgi:hypothetical protein